MFRLPRTARSLSALLLASALLASCGLFQPEGEEPETERPDVEVRGLWVDAFGPGIKTPDEVTRLVSDARRMNVNTLYVQIGRRGDCYCDKAAMPRTDDPTVTPSFDPLADVIEKAHAQGIQVYAWIITTAIWNSATPPTSPEHAFNRHGLNAAGRDNWLMVKNDGTLRGGADWYLDPGHPDAAEYIKNMYVSVARNYAVDGVQFDRVRYPDYNPVGGPNNWGYNETALGRFRAETGATGTPEPGDPAWTAWRRQQVTNLVRETALAVKAVKPDVAISAATITYGEGPADEAGFLNTRPYTEVLQDWPEWVRAGYLDTNVMMNYKRDHVEAQALWFGQWNAFAAGLKRAYPWTEQVSGAALYINHQEGSVAQVRQAQAAGLGGWAGYSYRNPDLDVAASPPTKTQAVAFEELAAKLTAADGPFPTFAPRPGLAVSALRAVSGRVTGERPGGHTVELLNASGQVVATTQTDGNGHYGFFRVPAGTVSVRVGGQAAVSLTARAGRVTRLADVRLP